MAVPGTAIGSAAINAACITFVWLTARRLFRPAVVAAVMAGTLLLLATLGLSWLIDARQQYAMVIPLYALFWLTAAMWAGVGVAVPLAVAVASLCVQTHFTFAYQAAVAVAAGMVAFVVVTRRRPGGRAAVARTGAWAVLVGLVCWIQPLIDQFFVTGNLGKALGPARERAGAGFETGARALAGGSLDPPFWLPGSIDDFLLPHIGVSFAGAVLTIAAWLLAAAAVAALGARTGSSATTGAALAAIVALVAALVGGTRIPVSSFGLVPQNYYWVWSVGAFVTIALAAGLLELPTVATRLRRWPGRTRRAAVLLAVAGLVAVAAWPRYPVESVAVDEVEADRMARPLRSQLAAAFATGVVGDVVEVDLSRAFFGNDYPYVLLAELQRAGVEFRFPPEVGGQPNTNLNRFGTSRCAAGGRHDRVLIISGLNPRLAPGSRVIAEVVGITDGELSEYRQLQAKFGELLRAGTVRADLDRVASFLGEVGDADKLRELLVTDGMGAGGLARSLHHWRGWGFVDVPASEVEAFDRWMDLEHRSVFDYQTVVVENPAPGSGGSC